FAGIGERLQGVKLRPEVAIFGNGVAMEGAAVQPLLKRRLFLGRDITGIEPRDPSPGLSLDGCRIGKCENSAPVSHYAFTPSTELLCILGFGKSRRGLGYSAPPASLPDWAAMRPHVSPATQQSESNMVFD